MLAPLLVSGHKLHLLVPAMRQRGSWRAKSLPLTRAFQSQYFTGHVSPVNEPPTSTQSEETVGSVSPPAPHLQCPVHARLMVLLDNSLDVDDDYAVWGSCERSASICFLFALLALTTLPSRRARLPTSNETFMIPFIGNSF